MDAPDLHDLLASIPGWHMRPAKIVPLAGGYNNQSYRVESDGYAYVLRVALTSTTPGGIDRELEVRLQQQAAARGLASPVLYSDPERGVMLMENLPGMVLTRESLSTSACLEELALLLRYLHDLPLAGVNFNAADAADTYITYMKYDATLSKFGKQYIKIIKDTPAPTELRCCHNDVVAANLIRGNTLKLIDFEYACDNDPLFDLACVIRWHELGERESYWLLDAYAGGVRRELQERLEQQCRLYDALLWFWLAERQQRIPEDWAARQMGRVQQRLG